MPSACGRLARRSSPSSRRAWVEILITAVWTISAAVALLAEGVGRNPHGSGRVIGRKASPSSRRAWVEMPSVCQCWKPSSSPSSRRAWVEIIYRNCIYCHIKSPSSRRAWVEIYGSPFKS